MFGDGKVPAGYFAGEYDLINRAKGLHYYVFEVDDRTDFAEFREKAAKRRLAVSEKDGTVSYGLYDCRLAYGGAFTVGGREFSPDFRRPRDVIGETV
jgi:hypothetical protein